MTHAYTNTHQFTNSSTHQLALFLFVEFLEIQGKLAAGGDASTSVDGHGHAVRKRSLDHTSEDQGHDDKLGVNSVGCLILFWTIATYLDCS